MCTLLMPDLVVLHLFQNSFGEVVREFATSHVMLTLQLRGNVLAVLVTFLLREAPFRGGEVCRRVLWLKRKEHLPVLWLEPSSKGGSGYLQRRCERCHGDITPHRTATNTPHDALIVSSSTPQTSPGLTQGAGYG